MSGIFIRPRYFVEIVIGMKIIWIILIIKMLCMSGITCYPNSRARRYCGDNLVWFLGSLCDGKYHSPTKKFDIASHSIYDVMNYIIRFNDYENGISNDVIDANVLVHKDQVNPSIFNRVRRGIVEECCLSPCTEAVLLTYCEK